MKVASRNGFNRYVSYLRDDPKDHSVVEKVFYVWRKPPTKCVE